MTMTDFFKDFCTSMAVNPEELSSWQNRIKHIAKRLNNKYYGICSEEDNLLIVGSSGRGTAIHHVSDFDCVFELPADKFKQYDEYTGNGQSALLQEVKSEILERYPTTDIKGDGQVVVISFADGNIELVPAFRQSNDTFKYPDSHNNGSWKITNPIPEICAANKMDDLTNHHYVNFCGLARKWKNNTGFRFKGLLIDTMTKKFFDSSVDRYRMDYNDYFQQLMNYFKFLSEQDSKCAYWHAMGSNQQIYNNDDGKFVRQAGKAFNQLKDIDSDSDESISVFKKLFGRDFAKNIDSRLVSSELRFAPDEEFIRDKFVVDVRYNLEIDCDIEQNGFRVQRLSNFLRHNLKLRAKKNLIFYVVNTDIPKSLDVKWYWKVRNTGQEAIDRRCERGQIVEGNKKHNEPTCFSGNHYVECYAVFEQCVIARAHIDVPIDTIKGKDSV